ncbi:MAG: ADP-ribosylglycohydrolase [Arenicella sp.]|jgi:ADP-ribosylglycohydrolase
MKGAIIGDIIGSRFEKSEHKSKEFELFTRFTRFTDDSVLTIAVAKSILTKESYEKHVKEFAQKYPKKGYGSTFHKWFEGKIEGAYNSWGNGSAMRVSSVGWAFETEEEVLKEAKKSAEITHNHPEGIKGAQAIALGVFLARKGKRKMEIKERISTDFDYDLNRTIDEIRPIYKFDVSCQGSVPEAIIAFLEAEDFEDTIRTAISIGGDSDTIACMACALAEAHYGEIPQEIEKEAMSRLTDDLREVVIQFYEMIGK